MIESALVHIPILRRFPLKRDGGGGALAAGGRASFAGGGPGGGSLGAGPAYDGIIDLSYHQKFKKSELK